LRAQSDMEFEEELAILETRNEKKGAAAAATKKPAADGGKAAANAAKKTETAAAVQKKVNGVALSLAKTNINSTKTAKEDVSGTFGTAVRTYIFHSSVADPVSGSGAFLTSGSGIRNTFFSGSRIPNPYF
jgi:hypothetical protein